MTCYDPKLPRGGMPFQRLMRLLLSGVSNARSAEALMTARKDGATSLQRAVQFTPNIERKGDYYFDAEGPTYGNDWFADADWNTPIDDYNDTMGDQIPVTLRTGTAPNYTFVECGSHTSIHSRPFTRMPNDPGKLGLYQGAVYPNTNNGSIQRHIGTNFGFLPLSMCDFMSKAGLFSTEGQTSDTILNNSSFSFNNSGIDLVGSCWEIGSTNPNKGEPCMLIGNSSSQPTLDCITTKIAQMPN